MFCTSKAIGNPALLGMQGACMYDLPQISLQNQSDWNVVGMHEIHWQWGYLYYLHICTHATVNFQDSMLHLPANLQQPKFSSPSASIWPTGWWSGYSFKIPGITWMLISKAQVLIVCIHYLHTANRMGLDAHKVAFAVKKYKSHQHVGRMAEILEAICLQEQPEKTCITY